VLENVILAIAAPLAFASLWGLLAAPKAPRRLRDPWRLLFEAIAFTLAAIALAAADKEGLAGIFLVLTLANALVVRAFGEPRA
jgi:ABC-type Na+ efflux pump permease subunit